MYFISGSFCFAAWMYMLSINQRTVNDHITSFIAALCMMSGSYSCFNIHYSVERCSTLEFLQGRNALHRNCSLHFFSVVKRCFFTINPEKSTKLECRKDKKQFAVNLRVCTFISDLADHEWKDSIDARQIPENLSVFLFFWFFFKVCGLFTFWFWMGSVSVWLLFWISQVSLETVYTVTIYIWSWFFFLNPSAIYSHF